MEKKRNLGIDVLCCLGVMMLLGVQYIEAVGFADAPFTSAVMTLPVAARWFCLSGAMLLAACMGYVLSGKKFRVSYFRILWRLGYIYIVCSLLGIGIRSIFLLEDTSFWAIIQSLCQFTASDTGRFAGMYFAVLLAAPFLNAALRSLKSQKAWRIFLLITAGVSTLQPLLRIKGFYLIPVWCKGLFPVAAYLGGAYVKRFQKKKNVPLCLTTLLLLVAGQTLLIMLESVSLGELACTRLDSMASLPCFLIALCLLRLFHSQKEKDSSVGRFFTLGAGGALCALLLGDPIIDALMPLLDEPFADLSMLLLGGVLVVPVLFIICCVVGLLLQIPFFWLRSLLLRAPEEDEDEEEEERPRSHSNANSKKKDVVVPRRVLTQPARTRVQNNPRHTILVPVSQPERSVRLTQPADEAPPGVHEVHTREPEPAPEPPPPPPEPASPLPGMEDTAKLYIPRHERGRTPPPEPPPPPPESTSDAIHDILKRLEDEESEL